MKNGFNQVTLAGNLTRDPELRYTPKGTAVAKIGMAVNRTWKDEGGNEKEECTFVDVDAFGRQAEVICQYVKKGMPLLVSGRLKLDQWDDKKTGAKRQRLGVVLETFTFLDSGKRDESAPAAKPSGKAPQRNARAPKPTEQPDPEKDDVPY